MSSETNCQQDCPFVGACNAAEQLETIIANQYASAAIELGSQLDWADLSVPVEPTQRDLVAAEVRRGLVSDYEEFLVKAYVGRSQARRYRLSADIALDECSEQGPHLEKRWFGRFGREVLGCSSSTVHRSHIKNPDVYEHPRVTDEATSDPTPEQ